MTTQRMPTDEEMVRQAERLGQIMMTLPADLPDISRFVMATDLEHAERLRAMFDSGEIDAERYITLCGSFARLPVATTLWEQGLVSEDWFFDRWPSLWRGSDPDDTDPKYWDIWQQVFKHNGGRVLDDPTHDLPGKGSMVQVYRGQRAGDPVGCAWTTVVAVAQGFASHGGVRAPIKGGRVLRCRVPKAMVLAYLTGRNECEVVIDPREMGWVKPAREDQP